MNSNQHVEFERILKRGTGQVIEESERSLFIYDSISKGCFLTCDDLDLGMDILDKHLTKTNDLLMVTDDAIGDAAVCNGFGEGIHPKDDRTGVYSLLPC